MYSFNSGGNLKIRSELCDFRGLILCFTTYFVDLFGGFGNLSYLCGVNVNYHL